MKEIYKILYGILLTIINRLIRIILLIRLGSSLWKIKIHEIYQIYLYKTTIINIILYLYLYLCYICIVFYYTYICICILLIITFTIYYV